MDWPKGALPHSGFPKPSLKGGSLDQSWQLGQQDTRWRNSNMLEYWIEDEEGGGNCSAKTLWVISHLTGNCATRHIFFATIAGFKRARVPDILHPKHLLLSEYWNNTHLKKSLNMSFPTNLSGEKPVISPNSTTDGSLPESTAAQPTQNTTQNTTQTKTEAEEAADRLYEERIEEEYAKREGGAWVMN
jgi:hypothetical protein